MPEIVQEIGAYAGLASVLGLAVLSALYFSQARDVKRLREWAGRAPERAEHGAPVVPGRVVAQPQRPGAAPGGAKPGPPAVPGAPAARPGAPAVPGGPKPAPGVPRPAAPALPGAAAATAAAGARPAAATAAGARPATATAQGPATDEGESESAAAGDERGAATATEERGAPATPDEAGAAATPPGSAPAKADAGSPEGPSEPGAAEDAGKGDVPGAPAPGGAPDRAPSVPATAPAGAAAAAAAAASPNSKATTKVSGPGAGSRAGAPPVPGARPAAGRGGPGRPVPQQTAVIAPGRRDPWYRRLASNPLYLVLAVAGVLIVGGAAAFGVTQLVGDDEGGGTAEGPRQVAEERAGDGAEEGQRERRRGGGAVNPANVTVAVLNGTTVPGLAATIMDRAEAAGFRAGTVANFLPNQELGESVVQYIPGHERDAAAVSRRLQIAQREAVNPSSQELAGDATVVVLVGADLAP